MSAFLDADPSDLSTTGGCLCSEVSYRVNGPLRPVVACHCSQCRRNSGHFVATTSAPRNRIEIEGEVRWYRSSDHARRGFCPICGSNLFWEGQGDQLAISAGSLDGPTGLTIKGHIFCADKGDYYEIPGDQPKAAGNDDTITEQRG